MHWAFLGQERTAPVPASQALRLAWVLQHTKSTLRDTYVDAYADVAKVLSSLRNL